MVPTTRGGDYNLSEIYEPQRFSPSNSISIVMEIQDDSGVEEVYALFLNSENRKHRIGLHGDGRGRTRHGIRLETRTAITPAPGEYRCQYIHVRDIYGNYAISYPDRKICFHVDGPRRRLRI